jgi:hypothetical protein
MSKYEDERKYEKEIEDAAKRIKTYPESLKAARDSDIWIEFLTDVVNVNPATVESDKAQNFWDDVRFKLMKTEISFTPRDLAEANVDLITGIYRDAKGRFTKTVTDKPVYSYRDMETSRFVSKKTIESRL